MCGICGIFYLNQNHVMDKNLLVDMRDQLTHRGPDDAGIYLNQNIGLGHRRLSIVDLSPAGHQPMSNEDGSIWVVYNGEIYNYLEIKRELMDKGHLFRSNTDTETIIHAYEEFGKECVKKFRGMFAFAIWDNREKHLFLSRDRMGIKPLYYYHSKDVFIFSSEIKAILASNMIEREVETSVLDAFLSLGYVPSPLTMFKGISKLLPGYSISVNNDGKFQIARYWNLNFERAADISFEEAQEELDLLLKQSVKMHLMSEVSLGIFLSGGLDSSAVTALMSKVTDQTIKTFSVGYKGADEANELEFARKVANIFRTEHHEFILQPYDFLDSIPRLVEDTEEPLVETAAIPLYYISKKAKEFATVLLSGEGSDEIFAGYDLYRKMLSIEKNRIWLRPLSLIPDAWLYSDKHKKYLDWFSMPLSERYRGTSCDLTKRIKKDFYSPELFNHSQQHNYIDKVFTDYFKEVNGQLTLSQLLYVDTKTWLLDDLLLKADKMTMSTSVELRVPFLDHKVVEFATSLPPQYKLNKQGGKLILKKLMERYLPQDIIYRSKMGFAVPTRRWFGSNLLDQVKQILLSKPFLERGFFQKEYIENKLKNHQNGKEDNSRRIFSLLVLDRWFKTFIDI
ncbi:MAG: asparagine synthase (glutamine-hydrolyzing) [Nitrospirota bacterium]